MKMLLWWKVKNLSPRAKQLPMKDKQLPRLAFKLWLETSDGYIYGPGVHALLQKIKETGTLKEAALALEMSYRYAWGLIKKAEENIGEHLITAHKGGRSGGGGTALTDVGQQYINEFNEFKKTIMEASKQEKTIHVVIKGKILEECCLWVNRRYFFFARHMATNRG